MATATRVNPWADDPQLLIPERPIANIGDYRGGVPSIVVHISAYDPGGVRPFFRHIAERKANVAPYHGPADPRRREIGWCTSLEKATAGLRNDGGTGGQVAETNRWGKRQLVWLGDVGQIQSLTDVDLRWLGEVQVAPVARVLDIDLSRRYPSWYSTANGTSGRISAANWNATQWLVNGHQHCPDQRPTYHWDPCLTTRQINVVMDAAQAALENNMPTLPIPRPTDATCYVPVPAGWATLTGGAVTLSQSGRASEQTSTRKVYTVTASIDGSGGSSSVPPGACWEVRADGGVIAVQGAPDAGALSAYPTPIATAGSSTEHSVCFIPATVRNSGWHVTNMGGVITVGFPAAPFLGSPWGARGRPVVCAPGCGFALSGGGYRINTAEGPMTFRPK